MSKEKELEQIIKSYIAGYHDGREPFTEGFVEPNGDHTFVSDPKLYQKLVERFKFKNDVMLAERFYWVEYLGLTDAEYESIKWHYEN